MRVIITKCILLNVLFGWTRKLALQKALFLNFFFLPPLFDGEYVWAFFVLCKNDPLSTIQIIKLPCQLFFESEWLNVQLENFGLVWFFFGKLNEILNFFHVCIYRLNALCPEMRVGSSELRKLEKLSANSLLNHIFINYPLERNSTLEQFIEVKVVLHQEIYVRTLELNVFRVHNRGRRKYIKIEGSHYVCSLLYVPLKCCYSPLEGVHALASMLYFLVLVLCRVIPVLLVIEPNAQSWKLGINRNKIGRFNRPQD